MSERACATCGHPVSALAQFCAHCGAALPDAPQMAVTDAADGTQPRVPWRAIEAAAVFLIHLLVTAVILVPIVAVVGDTDMVTAVGILVSEVVLLVTVLAWAGIRHGVGLRELGVRGVTAANVGLGVAVGIAGVIGAAIVSAVLRAIVEGITNRPVHTPDQISLQAEDPTGGLLVIIGVSVILLAPVAEELFFRGFLYQGYRRWARPVPAMLASAAVFSVTHVIPMVLLPIFALGFLLAWIVEKRDSIVPAIVAHMLFNVVGFTVLFAARA